MKKLALLVVVTGSEKKKAELDYKAQILAVLGQPAGPNGTDYNEMAAVLPVIQKITEAPKGGVVYLEDADHTLVANRMKNARYGLNSQEVFDMIRHIAEAPNTPACSSAEVPEVVQA